MQLVGIIQQIYEPVEYNGVLTRRVAVRYSGCTHTKTAVFTFIGRVADYVQCFTKGQKVRVYYDLNADAAMLHSRVKARSIEPYEGTFDNNE